MPTRMLKIYPLFIIPMTIRYLLPAIFIGIMIMIYLLLMIWIELNFLPSMYFHSVYISSSLALPPLDDVPSPVTLKANIPQRSLALHDSSIGPTIFRSCAGPLTNPVHYFILMSLRSQFIPLEWRTHSTTKLSHYVNLVISPL